MNNRWARAGGLLGLWIFLFTISAQGTPLTLLIDVEGQGLAVSEGGVGLHGIGSGTRTLTVDIGGPVQAALLYWTGRDRPCPQSGGTCVIPSQPYKDQVLRFDGNPITGTVIGTEAQPVSAGGPINNIGYLADVTTIVQGKGTGLQTFTLQDGNTSSNLFRLNGAGLLVIHTDAASPNWHRLMVFHGLDFAYGNDPTPGPTRVTVPITFPHGVQEVARQARLLIFSGDAVVERPDRIDISNNPSVVNGLDGSDGMSWDTDAIVVNIPVGVAATTVQLFSEPRTQNPDSLLWILGALRMPLDPIPLEETGCTPGYWKNHAGSWAGTGYLSSQTTGSVFSGANTYPRLAAMTLLQILQGSGGGPGVFGGARILLRAAMAALLNAAHSGVNYPRTTAEILADVNAALVSRNRQTMLDLASELDHDNNLGCPLN
ncbi:MAG TPA: hypothetical protein VF756_15485 [Thermoanaerobaculia bacterium]